MWRFFLILTALLGSLLAAPSAAHAKDKAAAGDPQKWCAQGVDGIEALPGDVCYLNGNAQAAHRTLVVFLHGAVAKNTTWQHNHQKMMLRLAKGNHVDILFPRSPKSDVGYVWPGSLAAQETVEQALIDDWMNAKRVVEQRDGRPYDEVFVMGFSSGAYFTSSLAMRGRLDVDGYAVFAGGQGMGARATPIQKFAPVFVGVCSEDDTSASHSRAFGGALSAAGIPRMVMEQPVGHGISDVHFNRALGYLRHANKKKPQSVAML